MTGVDFDCAVNRIGRERAIRFFRLRLLFLVALALLIVLALTACAEQVQGAPKAGDNVQVPAIEWRIRSPEQLAKIYAGAGKELHDKQAIDGFIARTPEGRVVIYTPPPKTVDDRVTDTLGHEFMHAALGDYHRKQEAK